MTLTTEKQLDRENDELAWLRQFKQNQMIELDQRIGKQIDKIIELKKQLRDNNEST